MTLQFQIMIYIWINLKKQLGTKQQQNESFKIRRVEGLDWIQAKALQVGMLPISQL